LPTIFHSWVFRKKFAMKLLKLKKKHISTYFSTGKPLEKYLQCKILFKLKGGGPHFLDSQGNCWTAAYINEGGNVVRDLRANIASEAGARQTYEALIKASNDEGTKKTLTHLLTREITHAHMFMKALDSIGKLTDPMFGNVAPDDTVRLVFHLSRGEDERGPWNEAPAFDYIEDPQPHGGMPPAPVNPDDEPPAKDESDVGSHMPH